MHRFRPRRSLVVLAGALLLSALPRQAPAGQFAQRGRRGGTLEDAMRIPAQDEIQLFGATVARVRVDVIVTDGDGNFVTDLGRDDFTVYEDGEPQEILDVQLVDLAAGAVQPLVEESEPVAVRSGGEAVSRRSPEAEDNGSSAASELGAVIFLIDGPSLSVDSRARFGDAWTEMLEQTEGLQVPRAAYMVDNAGRLQELAPLGYDVEAMRAAADTVRAAPFFGDQTRQRLIELATDLTDPNLPEDAAARLAAAKARTYEGQERSRSLAAYELLTSFAEALWSRSGRTAVVWVSSGIKLMQGGPYAQLVGDQRATFSPDPSIHTAQEELHRAANGSNVSIYTVDPSLLTGSRNMGGDVEIGRAGAAQLLQTPEIQQSLDALRDAMRSAAAETGGRSFIHATDLEMVLEEIEEDTGRFYLVTYAPPAPDGDGEWHDIRVEVARAGTDVRARGGYVDHAPEERAQRLIAAALALPGSVTDLPVQLETFRSRRAPGDPNVLMAVAVDGGEVGIMLTRQGERRVSLDVHAIALRDGNPVDESHEQLNMRSAANGVFQGSDGAASQLYGIVAYEHEWALEPGSYTLNVAAYDNVTGRVGASSVALEVPADDGSWGTSDPMLVTIDDAGHVAPVVLGRVTPNQSLAAFVEVYGGTQPILSGQVFLEGENDEDEPPQSARLFPQPLRRIAGATHSGSAPLPPGMPPGRYIVQLTITDPPAGQHRVVRLPIQVIEPPQR